jgi:Chlorophyll A-B binding protein
MFWLKSVNIKICKYLLKFVKICVRIKFISFNSSKKSKFWSAIGFNPHDRKSEIDIMNSSKKVIIPTDRNKWVWGFTPQAEIWNGRLAMLGISSVAVTEFLSRQGGLHFYYLLHTTAVVTSIVP